VSRIALACVLTLLLAACAAPAPEVERIVAAPHFYVVLGDEGRAVARVITRDGECPAIELDGISVPMAVRALPATIPLRPTRSPSAT